MLAVTAHMTERDRTKNEPEIFGGYRSHDAEVR